MWDQSKRANQEQSDNQIEIGDDEGGSQDSTSAGRDIHQKTPVSTYDQRGQQVGNQTNIAGDFIQHRAEEAYDVRSLLNPYLGLHAFTYEERGRYAGREHTIEQALKLLTLPGEQRTLLFITGASGSGKSSFAQAGLLPALETHYTQRNQTVRWAVFRPSRQPLAGFADALLRLGLPAEGIFAAAGKYMLTAPEKTVSGNQISLLVIDQFEELFTQSVPDQRDKLFEMLESLPDFAELRTHVIATLRIDYLPELFARKTLYDIAKQGIDLRAMNIDELKLAIQRPLQQAYPKGEKRFEEALLEKLAGDAAEDAAYLPLLQVSLEDIWRRGSLQLSAYGELTDAIQQRAEEVYTYTVDAEGQRISRTEAEPEAILDVFLDLVEVSLDEDQHRDVRRQRPEVDLVRDKGDRLKLIEELVDNRLLSKSIETQSGPGEEIEVVDIIHESLIVNWKRLQDAIAVQRDILQQRTRFEYALSEWLSEECNDAYLLDGVRLAEAESLDRNGDIALQNSDAQELLKQSIDQREARQQRELEQARRRTLTLGVAFVITLIALIGTGLFFQQARIARKTAEDEVVQRTKAEAIAVAEKNNAQAAATAAVQAQNNAELARKEAETERSIAQAAATAAVQAQNQEAEQRQLAEQHRKEALARQLAVQAISSLESKQDIELSLLLAAQAGALINDTGKHIQQVDNTLRQVLAVAPKFILRHKGGVNRVVFSSDGRRLIIVTSGNTTPSGTTVHLVNTSNREVLISLQYGERPEYVIHGQWVDQTALAVEKMVFSPDGHRLIIGGDDGMANLVDTASGQVLASLQHEKRVEQVLFSPDGHRLIIASDDGMANLVDTASGQVLASLQHEKRVEQVLFSPDGHRLIIGGDDGMANLVDTASGQVLASLQHEKRVEQVLFSPDGHRLIIASDDGTANLVDTASGEVLESLQHEKGVRQVLFSPDGHRLVMVSVDGTANLVDTASGQVLALLQHEDKVNTVDFSLDGQSMATASQDHTVRLWDSESGDQLALLQHEDNVRSAVFSPDGSRLATRSADKTVRLWESESGEQLALLQHEAGVNRVVFSPDGRRLATASDDGMAYLIDTASGEVLKSLRHEERVKHVLFSPDSSRLLTFIGGDINFDPSLFQIVIPSTDSTAYLIDASSGKVLTNLEHKMRIEQIVFSSDGHYLATSTVDGSVRLVNTVRGHEPIVLQQEESVKYVLFSSDNSHPTTTRDDDSVRIAAAAGNSDFSSTNDTADGIDIAERIAREHMQGIKQVAFSSDGRRLVIATYDLTNNSSSKFKFQDSEPFRDGLPSITDPIGPKKFDLPDFDFPSITDPIGPKKFDLNKFDLSLLSGKGLSDKGQTERGGKKNPP
ncbi:PQQ-binding-like beta-propeller repeat protein [Chloroflexi bacterium TSY]|nr:PQQ-binding-like beta-propeller repeat protein [Chloroflexi bacterium TSY]